MKHSLRTPLLSWAAAACLGLCLASTAQAQDFKWPKLMAIGTPSTQGATFASTNGWAPLLQKDTGMTVRIVPEDSELQRWRRLTDRKDLQLSSVTGSEMRSQIEGIGGYIAAKPQAQRIVWHHADTPWGLVVSGKSDIHSMEDLKKKGTRVVDGIFAPTITVVVRKGLPAYLGMSEEEASKVFEYVPASSYPENCKAVTEGKADAAYCTPVSSVLSEMEGAPGGIRWIGMPAEDKQAWDRYLNVRPDAIPGVMELGVASARGVPGAISNFLYASSDTMDENLAYNLAKWMHQSYDEYKGTHPLSSRMSLEVFRAYLDRTPYPVHPGTIKYLREIKQWSDADDAANAQAIARMDQWIAARKAGLEEAAKAKIKPDFQDEKFLQIMRKHTDGLEIFRSRL